MEWRYPKTDNRICSRNNLVYIFLFKDSFVLWRTGSILDKFHSRNLVLLIWITNFSDHKKYLQVHQKLRIDCIGQFIVDFGHCDKIHSRIHQCKNLLKPRWKQKRQPWRWTKDRLPLLILRSNAQHAWLLVFKES